MSRFQVNLSQNQIRADEQPTRWRESCATPPSSRSTSETATGCMKYLDPNYAEQELANWAREKFGIEVKPGGIHRSMSSGHNRLPAEQIIDLIESRAGPPTPGAKSNIPSNTR